MIKSEVVSYVIAEFLKEKMVSGSRAAVSPGPEDISLIIKCFLSYGKVSKNLVDGVLHLDDIVVEN